MKHTTTTHTKSGRTSRLIRHAHELARTGKHVVIVADNGADARMIELRRWAKDTQAGDAAPGSVEVRSVHSLHDHLDWQSLRVRGMGVDHVVLVDHHAIEDHFQAVLSMLRAYDA